MLTILKNARQYVVKARSLQKAWLLYLADANAADGEPESLRKRIHKYVWSGDGPRLIVIVACYISLL